MWPKLSAWIHKHEASLFVICIAAILRLPSLLEPYWYGDETLYLTVGLGLRRGLELYKSIHDNKPPFLYLLAALSNGELFWLKFCAFVSSLLAIAVFSRFTKKWALLIFGVLISIPLLEANIANAELFFLLPTITAFYLCSTHKNNRQLFWAGLVLGIGGLLKIPALLEVAIFPIYWLITGTSGWLKKSSILLMATLIPLGFSVAYFSAQGSFSSYLIAVGIKNIPYVSSWHPNVFLIGTLVGRAFALITLVIILWTLRKKLPKHVLLASLWFLVSLFAALLSGRSYPHYLLQTTPALALLIGIAFERKKYIWVPLLFLTILLGCFKWFGFQRYPTLSYYSNFISWVTKQKDLKEYYAGFGPGVNRDYEIASVIARNTNPQDKIFMWGDETAIYALSKRLPVGIYTAKYHITDFQAEQATILALETLPPKFIVTFNAEANLVGLPKLLSEHYVLDRQIENAQVYRRVKI